VFYEEGYSLKQYMYTEVQAQEYVIYGQSELWRQLRLDRGGAIVMKQLLYQLIQGVADLHAAGITHRDIKVCRSCYCIC
jgi:serine/threonine protein kinase